MTRTIALFLSAAVIGLGVGCPESSAQMTMTLSGSPGSSVIGYEISGSSIASSSFGPFVGMVFDMSLGEEPFPAEVTTPPLYEFGVYPLASGGGTVTNLTSSQTRPVTGVGLQDSALFGVARFGVDFDPGLTIAAGDTLEWTGSGAFDLAPSGVTFDQFVPGVYPGDSFVVGGFKGILIIVPEPATGVTLLLATLLAGPRRRRR